MREYYWLGRRGWGLKPFAKLLLGLSIPVFAPAAAEPIIYSYNDYNGTPGYKGWTYWDSLGQQMVWDGSSWKCVSALDPYCGWGALGGAPGVDRNVVRRWTSPGAGSAHISGWTYSASNACPSSVNVALGKPSSQSSCEADCWGGVPSRGNDGNTDGDFWAGSVFHTDYEYQPWYQIDLGAPTEIRRIDVWNRSDSDAGRATNFTVSTSTTGSSGSWTTVTYPGQAGYPTSFVWHAVGRYVRVQLLGTDYLHLAEVEVFDGGADGVDSRIAYKGNPSNWYLTTPHSPYVSTRPLPLSCGDTKGAYYEYDQEVYPGDTLEFSIDGRSNSKDDMTFFYPTIAFESADAVNTGPYSAAVDAYSVKVAFDGYLECPNGSICNYTRTFPPDYYKILDMQSGTSTTIDNYAPCGPADVFCITRARPYFSHTYTGLTPNTGYKFKISAFRNDRLYGQSSLINVTTPALSPPALLPHVSLTAPSSEYGARDVVIEWQTPPGPLDTPQYLERFEVYRQGFGSAAPTSIHFKGVSTGNAVCAGLGKPAVLGQSRVFSGQWTCVATTAPGGGCSDKFAGGTATCVSWDPPVRLGYTRWTNGNTTQQWINTANQSVSSDAMHGVPIVINSVVDPGVDRKPTTYRYYVVARYWGLTPNAQSEVTTDIVLPRANTVAGFADTHVHQFANLAHGGEIVAGRSGDLNDGSPTYSGALVDMGGFFSNATGAALRGCDAIAAGGTGAHDFGQANILIDLAGASHDKSGIRNISKWINHANSLHQQVYKTALKRAVDGGLRLMVMQAVNSEVLCKLLAEFRVGGRSAISCDDSTALDGQITAAYRFQSEIDKEAGCLVPEVGTANTNLDNDCGWYRIVTNPVAARKVIRKGKLAVVLGLEADTIFHCGTGQTGPWAAGDTGKWYEVPGTRDTCSVGGNLLAGFGSLQFFFDRGVRHVFPIHGINNGLGSPGIFKPSELYVYNQALLNGSFFRTGLCLDRSSGQDPPLTFRTSPALKVGIGPFGAVDFGPLLGIPPVPAGYPEPLVGGATCNIGGNFGVSGPRFGLTALGRSVLQEMMKRRMLIDVDHMSELSHIDAVAESAKSFNYPLVSGHAVLQRSSRGTNADPASEVALSTPELNEVRASGGTVNLVAVASFKVADIAQAVRLGGNAAAMQFQSRAATVTHDCDNSSKSWAQVYLTAVDLTRNAPVPIDNSERGVYSVGFGSDFGTMMNMLQPRFGYDGQYFFGCSDISNGGMTSQQGSQLDEDARGVDRAVQYDVDAITRSNTVIPGYGGINTSLPPDAANNFPGFDGPVLLRSRLNEGGFLFTLYRPDGTACLDSWGYSATADYPRIDDCGEGRWLNQQWLYAKYSKDTGRITPFKAQGKALVVDFPPVRLDGGCTSDCDYKVHYSTTSDGTSDWTTLPSGQLKNPATGLCLSTEKRSLDLGARVVAAACTGGLTGLPYRRDQFWSRGSEPEDFNSTGLSHIGMYPDLIQDLKNIGLTQKDLIPLFQSAEGYLQMWERTGWTKAIEYEALSSDSVWKYAATDPGTGWQNSNYDDTAWRSVGDDYAPDPYGVSPWFADVANFPNPTPAKWLPIWEGNHTFYFRRSFVTDAAHLAKTVTISADDSALVFFDGHLVANMSNWHSASTFTFPTDSFGTHVIAIEATNSGGAGGVLVDVR